MHRGVYRSTAMQITQRQRLLAGLLAVGDDAVVSHRSALEVHGAPNFACSVVELTKRSSSLPMHRGLVVHRSSTIAPVDVTRVDRLWVTTKERTERSPRGNRTTPTAPGGGGIGAGAGLA